MCKNRRNGEAGDRAATLVERWLVNLNGDGSEASRAEKEGNDNGS